MTGSTNQPWMELIASLKTIRNINHIFQSTLLESRELIKMLKVFVFFSLYSSECLLEKGQVAEGC